MTKYIVNTDIGCVPIFSRHTRTVHVTCTIDFLYWQWISERSH